jgi:hypothetical protein
VTALANAARGEHSLTLAGIPYRLRPSFTAAQAIEAELGESLTALARRANAMGLNYTELGIIVAECIRAGADEDDRLTRKVSAERIAELIYEEGAAPVFGVLTVLLADAVLGGRTLSGEAKASAAGTANR